LSNLILPLPTKEEQDRIVEKADELFEAINEIEDNLVLAK
jgi:restriction endonuclease S subunit